MLAIFSASGAILVEDTSGYAVEVVVNPILSVGSKGSGSTVNFSRLKMSKGI